MSLLWSGCGCVGKLLSWADRLSLADLSVAFICSQVKVLPMHLPLAQE